MERSAGLCLPPSTCVTLSALFNVPGCRFPHLRIWGQSRGPGQGVVRTSALL